MSEEKQELPPAPPWVWVFVAACVAIPMVTLGGAIPMGVGFGGAAGCHSVSRHPTMSTGGKIAVCLGITVVCWAIVAAVVGGLAILMQKS
jgi:hypothetical protein